MARKPMVCLSLAELPSIRTLHSHSWVKKTPAWVRPLPYHCILKVQSQPCITAQQSLTSHVRRTDRNVINLVTAVCKSCADSLVCEFNLWETKKNASELRPLPCCTVGNRDVFPSSRGSMSALFGAGLLRGECALRA